MPFITSRIETQFPFIQIRPTGFFSPAQMPPKTLVGLSLDRDNQFRRLQVQAEGRKPLTAILLSRLPRLHQEAPPEKTQFSEKSYPLFNRTSRLLTAIAKTVHSFFQIIWMR
jgi:hypothetical protein